MKNELQSFCEQSLLDLERFPELNMRFIKQFWDSFWLVNQMHTG